MIDILKEFISMIINVFNTLFSVEIELTSDFKLSLGVLLIAAALIGVLLALLLNYLGINLGGDDD